MASKSKKAIVSTVPKSLLSLVRKVVTVKAAIQKLESSKLAVLKERFDGLSEKIKREMKAAKVTKVTLENALGYATLFDQVGPSKLDEKTVALKLGLPDLSEFKTPGKKRTVLKIGTKFSKEKVEKESEE